MIDLWYLDTTNIGQFEMERLVKSLPTEMAKEITRFRDHNDRCLALFGKLMVKKYNEVLNEKFSWSNWQTSEKGKPYYSKGKKFNISHSGNIVIVAFSDNEIGIDIEKCSDYFDINTIVECLHIEEKKFILDSQDPCDAFFTVWTRKEAYLKATGIGIVEGISNDNCLGPLIDFEKKWYLTSLSILKGYKLALCYQVSNSQINQLKLDPTIFLNE